jgi:hypothetical protein
MIKKPKGFAAKKAFVLNTGCYRQDIIVTMNMRGNDIEKLFKKWQVKPLSEEFKTAINEKEHGTGLYFYHSKSQHRLITLFPSNYQNAIAVFDHEKTHCVADVLRYIGIELTEDTEEAYAYLSEWLMLQFLKKA